MSTSDQWHKRIQQIPAIQRAGLRQWQPIQSGSSNHIFKVTTDAGVWLLRINRAALGIDRQQEKKILQQVADMGIGPTVIDNDPAAGYLITEYIDQPAWTQADLQSPKHLNPLKTQLQQVHQVPYEYLPSRLDHRLRLYLKHLKNTPEQTALVLLDTIEKLDFLGFWRANNTLYHSDLNPGNLLGHHPNTTIIDWEFAGQGHPLLDWLILEHEAQLDLSAHYPADILSVWLEPARRMIAAMMALWPHESP
ncbi:choline/ethanolamine kinase family protein [Marinicella meishanensis]|uniref:choline/ethanolamine kinase family protein n=1 Tax=Marinicella meishanensis TaxID=2873263 RepID=UPI001CBC5182|nr:choline/ethanolamine kinase family protein [Marinicella sp. NBU2979]